MGTTPGCCILFSTNFESSSLQNSSWMATYLPSRKLLKTIKTCWVLLEKLGQIHKQHSFRLTSVGSSTKNYIHQLCTDIWYRQEDLQIALTDSDKWWERLKKSSLCVNLDHVYIYIYIYIYNKAQHQCLCVCMCLYIDKRKWNRRYIETKYLSFCKILRERQWATLHFD